MSDRLCTVLLFCLTLLVNQPVQAEVETSVERFAGLALACVHQEYPNKIGHVLSSDQDVAPPRELTPVFYGCFDWHSSVHGHWLLTRLLRLYPQADFAPSAEEALNKSFTADKVVEEVRYVSNSLRGSFERPYGVAWLLQLTTELREWDDPRAKRWLVALEPLEAVLVEAMQTWLEKLAYPIRIGEHAQTAFAFGLFIDWARSADRGDFHALVERRSREFYSADRNCPLAYEPGGQDFLSPCLAEADLMRRFMTVEEYFTWLSGFMPSIPLNGSSDWLALAVVTDPGDGKLAHLDGLNISRAWMLEGIASALPDKDKRKPALKAAADLHRESGLSSVTGKHYEGGHWLGSFATYLETSRGLPVETRPVIGQSTAASRLALARLRISQWDGRLNAVMGMNPEADVIAKELDDELASGKTRGPLHGYPVLLKDNIETLDMPTTAGSTALAENHTERDAEVVRRLREAGLLIAGKANLSEWANFRDTESTSGWSGVGGLTVNAWDANRTACGSSSGSAVAVAAGYVPFALGTETDGSVICPASNNGIVGIKPTLGLVSRRGIVPISHSQDTAGPMALSVTSAAMLLSAMEGADPKDPITMRSTKYHGRDYTRELQTEGLRGLRVGIIRSQEFHIDSIALFDQAISDLGEAGAVIVDGLEFPEWPEGFWGDSLNVLQYEFKHDLNKYFATLTGELGSFTLEKLIAYNQAHAVTEMPWFGQDLLETSQAKDGLDSLEYKKALVAVQDFTRSSIDSLLKAYDVDVLIMRSNAPAFAIDLVFGDNYQGGSSTMAAVAGYPHITVPMGRWKGLPVGLSFVGTAFSEPVLIRSAYAYEQATRHAKSLAGKSPWMSLSER